jgi:argonaute-like protein implicated in RNA metabolism and viral defense
MTGLETNIFPIANLGDLSSRYRLYRIRGLHREQAEYHQNRSVLARRLSYDFKTPAAILDHEDGRLWQSEQDGLRKGLEALKAEGVLPPDATLTILEISKSSPAPLRLFDVTGGGDRRDRVQNPQVGCYHLAGPNGFVCATGRAFPREGTVRPLHVRHVEGPLPLEKCLEDVYSLTTLAWTRPEDCTRNPVTIKLTDRRLGEDASAYDADALEYEDAEEAQA